MVSTQDNMIGLELFQKGSFDKQLVESSCSMASAYLGRGNLTYVDVGANVGSNTVYAMINPAFSNAVCFEPDLTNFRNLVQTIDMSGIGARVRCVRTALGEAEGHARMELSSVNFGDHHLIPGGSSGAPGPRVSVTTLDASLTEAEIEHVGLLCIDVQGYEAQVLSGASILLNRDVPVLCEIAPGQMRRCEGYDPFFQIAMSSFNWFVDIRKPHQLRAISELRDCADGLGAGGHTDVFLTKRSW